jgi:hypothetical protein
MVFEPPPADGAFRIQVREMLAVLERARCRRALRAYQFADMARLDAALNSDGFKMLVADFDQACPHGVSRTLYRLEMVEERSGS